jgi:predicted DNA-binding transcriptional regulator AlpA
MSATDTDTAQAPSKLWVRSIQPLTAALLPEALLTMQTASKVAGLSPDTLYRRAKSDPSFPKLIRIGARCTRIRAGDLTAWLNSLGKSTEPTRRTK